MKLTTSSSSSSQNLMSIGGLLILAGLAAVYFFEMPQLKQANTSYEKAKADAASAAGDVQAIQNAAKKLKAAEDKITARQVNIDSISQVLPATEDLPSLYIQIQEVMTKSTQELSLKQPTYQVTDPVKSASGDVRIPVSISATGSYANLKQLITRYENNIRPVSFISLSIQSVPPTSSGSPDTDIPAGYFSLSASGYVRAQGLSPAYALKLSGK